MQRINPVVAAILCGVAVVIALFAWLNRYEYRVLEISPGALARANLILKSDPAVSFVEIWSMSGNRLVRVILHLERITER